MSQGHPNCRKGIRRGEDESPLPKIVALDGGELDEEKCWTIYRDTFKKLDWFVKNEKSLAIQRETLLHLAKMSPSASQAQELFSMAMERAIEDPWVNGKKDGTKHDSPHAVLKWENIQDWLDSLERES